MLCQDLGDFTHRRIPERPSIWVAGCGTNQAVITALAFPRATVLGSDVSQASLDVAARSMAELAIGNLALRAESINEAQYFAQFDYVICTGVIHHNANPEETLARLARSLRPQGVLQLMVYNKFHRVLSSSVQKAIRVLSGDLDPGSDRERELAEALVQQFEPPGRMGEFLAGLRASRPEEIADSLMQPVEHSYTIEGLHRLAEAAGLQIELPCLNQFDRARGNLDWNLQFSDRRLADPYRGLPDLDRWHVTNLLLCERSPLLWFYLRRSDAGTRVTEEEVCARFLETTFVRVAARRRGYTLGSDDRYHPTPGSIEYPAPAGEPYRSLLADADGRTPMAALLERRGFATEFPCANRWRLRLASSAFPHLRSVAG
jgi:SAM-dependent methyltransferase